LEKIVTIRIKAIDQATGAIGGVQSALTNAAGSLSKVSTQVQLAGFRSMAAVTFPITAMAKGLTSTAESFSEARNELEAVVSGAIYGDEAYRTDKERLDATEKAMSLLKTRAMEAAENSKFTTIEATQAQEFLARAGLNAEQTAGATKPSINAATALKMSTADTADKMTNAALSFEFDMDGAEATERSLGRIADLVATVSTRSNVSGPQAFETMKNLGAISVAIGQDMEEVLAMTGAMGDKGVQGNYAGVALRSTIARMLAPVKNVRTELKALNVDLSDFMSMKGAPDTDKFFNRMAASGTVSMQKLEQLRPQIDGILQDSSKGIADRMGDIQQVIIDGIGLKGADAEAVSESVSGFTASMLDRFDFMGFLKALDEANVTGGQAGLIFGKYHYDKILGLMKSFDRVKELEYILRTDAEEAADDMAAIKMKGVAGAMNRMREAWVQMQIAIGEKGGNEAIVNASQLIRQFSKAVGDLSPYIIKTTIAVGIFAAAVGPVLIYIGLMGQGIAALMATFGGLASVLTGIGGIFGTVFSLGATLIYSYKASVSALFKAVLSLKMLMASPFLLLFAGVAVGAISAVSEQFGSLGALIVCSGLATLTALSLLCL